MDFFKSILSENPDPQPDPNPESQPTTGATWTFNSLIKTIATQSETVIEIYKRDLKEFGSGLRSETQSLRQAATRLPVELDHVIKSTAQIISHNTTKQPSPSDQNPDSSSNNDLRKFSRFEAQLKAIRAEPGTYCNGAEDSEDFEKWRSGFVLEREDNETIDGVYKRVVPDLVDDETFWLRYYYKVHKLKQQENLRANLVKRAISVDLDEELSWDVDDEDEEDEGNVEIETTAKNKVLASEIEEKGEKETNLEKGIETSKASEKDKDNIVFHEPVKNDVSANEIEEREEKEIKLEKGVDNSEVLKNEEKVDSDLSIVSTQPSLPEEDLGWDEIEEDVESGDEKREKPSGSPNMADLRKRLSVPEEDEDLSWDIEDDDEPVTKSGAK